MGLDFRGEGSLIILPPSVNCRGESYSWLPGLSLDEVEPPPLPQGYLEFIRSNSFGNKGCGFQGEMFQDGNRDSSLFHTANCLVKGGMPEDEICQVLANLIISWGENPDAKWIEEKVQSALKRETSRNRNFTQEVKDLISVTSGHFRVSEMYRLLPNIGPQDRVKIRVILGRLVDEEIIERVGKEDGVFRRIENDEQRIDVREKSTGKIGVRMPFRLEEKVNILPKNIITMGELLMVGKRHFS